MKTEIIKTDFAVYRLQSAEIKQSQDGATSYVVANFAKAGLDELMAEQESLIRLQILPQYGASKEHAEAYLNKWVDKAKAGDYTCNIGTYEVGGFEEFLRKNTEGKYLTTNKDGKQVKTIFNSLYIYWFCDEEGIPVRGSGYITRRAENLFNNSQRIVTLAKYKELRAKSEAAKKLAESAKDDLVSEADGLDDEI